MIEVPKFIFVLICLMCLFCGAVLRALIEGDKEA